MKPKTACMRKKESWLGASVDQARERERWPATMAVNGGGTFADHVQPFQIEAVGVRGRLVRLGPAVDAAIRPHAYPAPVAAMVAEALALGVVLASGLKYDGVFSLQLQGEGPLRLVVIDVTSSGDLRACARFEAGAIDCLPPAADVPRLFGGGLMAFTVDQGPATERYQGITALEGASLGDCAHAYFRQSEQLETAISLCTTDFTASAEPPRAAALMIQRLPPAPSLIDTFAEDDWRRAVALMSSASVGEMLAPALPSAQLLYRLFHEDGVRIYRQRPLRHHCRCSRDRVVQTLRAFPPEELAEMAEPAERSQPPRIIVTCEFCKARFELTLHELAEGGGGHGPC
jgi:molecular chaperone Hsp33